MHLGNVQEASRLLGCKDVRVNCLDEVTRDFLTGVNSQSWLIPVCLSFSLFLLTGSINSCAGGVFKKKKKKKEAQWAHEILIFISNSDLS